MKKLPLVLIAIFIAALTPKLPAQIPGGFSEQAKTDESAIAAAKFAVNAHDPKLQFKAIEKVESQVVAGTNYRITLTVIDKDKTRRADVVVWHKLGRPRTYELTSWTWADGAAAK
jgi:hypothetical protein